MCIRRWPATVRDCAGFTLIELVVFIVVVGVGLAGIMSVFNITVMRSADPMVHKQMLSIAEALLEEVVAQPFTYCDPTDTSAPTATSTAGCTTAQGLGPGTTGQTRAGTATPFNSVPDYSGLATINPVVDLSGSHTFAGYAATIAIVAGDALGPVGQEIAPNDASAANLNLLRIIVTVSHGSESLALEGYRARHSPNALP